jgi:hypothetical protein
MKRNLMNHFIKQIVTGVFSCSLILSFLEVEGQDKKATLHFETGFELSAGWAGWNPGSNQQMLSGGFTKGIDFFIDLPIQEKSRLQMGMGIAGYQFEFGDASYDYSIASLKMFPRFWMPKWRTGVSIGGVLGFVNMEDGIQENGLLLESNDFTLGPVLEISHRILSLKHLRIYLSSKTSWLANPVVEIKNGQNSVERLTLVGTNVGLAFTYR